MANTTETVKQEDGITYMHISAKPGYPSTLWQGKSSKWYKSKKEAEKDTSKNTYDPTTITYQKSFWAQNKKTVLWCLAFVIVIAFLMWLWRTGTITYHAGRAKL